MSEPPEAAQGDFPSAQTGDKYGLTQPSEAQPRLNPVNNPLNQRQRQIKDESRNRKPANAQVALYFYVFFPQSEFHMILKTLPWKLQTCQDSSPSSSSSSSTPSLFFLFLLLPSAATAYFASTSASLPKEQDHFIFCSKLLSSPHFVTEQTS